MTGAYITHDGGRGWRMFNLRAPVHFFGFDPRSANRIDAGADGLWRSDDSGSNWNIVFPPAASVIEAIHRGRIVGVRQKEGAAECVFESGRTGSGARFSRCVPGLGR